MIRIQSNCSMCKATHCCSVTLTPILLKKNVTRCSECALQVPKPKTSFLCHTILQAYPNNRWVMDIKSPPGFLGMSMPAARLTVFPGSPWVAQERWSRPHELPSWVTLVSLMYLQVQITRDFADTQWWLVQHLFGRFKRNESLQSKQQVVPSSKSWPKKKVLISHKISLPCDCI